MSHFNLQPDRKQQCKQSAVYGKIDVGFRLLWDQITLTAMYYLY